MSAIVKFEAVTDLATRYGLDANAFLKTIASIAMPSPHTEVELVSCLMVAREHGLNPLTKEIYFMRDKHGKIQAIVGVDGWIRKINEHAQFDGIEFEDVREDGIVTAMTCRIYRKDRSRPIVVTEYLAECKQIRNKPGPWDTHPMRMLRNRTLCQTGRIAFGFAGLMEPDEFQEWQNNPELHEPIALETAPLSAREGGALPRSLRDRPAANAFKDLGGPDKYNALVADIDATETIEDLHACFDAYERHGQPWAEFPHGYAKLIQDHYHYRLKDLADVKPLHEIQQESQLKYAESIQEPDDPLTDQDGLVAAIEDALAGADSIEIVQEIIDGNVDLVRRCSPANRRKIAELYEGAMQ